MKTNSAMMASAGFQTLTYLQPVINSRTDARATPSTRRSAVGG
jgi:hypothetical protein